MGAAGAEQFAAFFCLGSAAEWVLAVQQVLTAAAFAGACAAQPTRRPPPRPPLPAPPPGPVPQARCTLLYDGSWRSVLAALNASSEHHS